MNTLIFKTNIKSQKDFEEVKKTLSEKNVISECTIDLEDVDRVLRVLADSLTIQRVEQEILEMGFYCKELEE
ncbi:MAG TPA: hypothetical protein VLB50_11495 [Ignavibacteriaceae bacterium]|nr:hypothetical protein [Ignavibacteriaceae bacterium]